MDYQPISFWIPLDISKSVDDSRTVCGIISTEDTDLEGEKILEELSDYGPMIHAMGKNLKAALADRIDFDRFSTRQGWLKWEHSVPGRDSGSETEPGRIIGWPTRIEKGIHYKDPIDGATKSGTAMWGELFAAGAKKSADDAWELITAIRKSNAPRRLGYSIEGAYLPMKDLPATTKACLVTNVVLTTKPVNSFAWADAALVKALIAGGGETDSAKLTGGAALREQSLFPNKLSTHQGGECNHLDEDGKPKSARAAAEHLLKCKGKSAEVVHKTILKLYGGKAA